MSFVFRQETSRTTHTDYDTWAGSLQSGCGVMQKFMTEELPSLDIAYADWANRYVQEHPDKVAILHLNLEGRQVTAVPAVHQRYFPGHWVYEAGSKLIGDLTADATELKVADATPFKVDAYLDHGSRSAVRWFPQLLCLVPVDETGKRDWYNSEYAMVVGLDKERKIVTVKRAQLFSKARAFSANRTYVAPMAASVWGGGPMAYYNFSTFCPKDRNGRNAGDVFAGEIGEWFSPAGPLAHFTGIGGDVNYWAAHEKTWDVNDDGNADGGVIGGVNTWRVGDNQFLIQARKAIGENRLFTSDDESTDDQRAVGVLDGMESEGLVRPNDAFRGLSRTINTHLYWAENTPRAHDFRYVVLKTKSPADEARKDQLQRFGVGVACCLGAGTSHPSADAMPKAFAEVGSLGLPDGPLIRPARQTPDLLKGHGLDASFDFKNGALTHSAGRIDLAPNGPEAMTVTLKGLSVPPGDLTVVLDMQSLDPLDGFAAGNLAPRQVDVRFSQKPDYGEGDRLNAMYSDLCGYFGTKRRSVMAFHLRRPSLGAQTIDVTFTVEGKGRASIYGLAAYSAPDSLVRSFKHGIVAVNPSLAPLEISLKAAGGGVGAIPATVQVPALDAAFVPK